MNRRLKRLVARFCSPVLNEYDCPILMYHRVLPREAGPILDDGICVTPELFEENLVFLKQHFDIVSLKDVLGTGRRIKKPCVITFDDGWLDTYHVAFPILRRLQIPATVFLPTGMIGTNRIFWYERVGRLIMHDAPTDHDLGMAKQRLETLVDTPIPASLRTRGLLYDSVVRDLKRLPPQEIEARLEKAEHQSFGRPQADGGGRILMNWDEVEEMGRSGITFGSHGVNHHILSVLTYEEQRFEIVTSRSHLLEKNVNFVDCISFPNGNYNQDTLDLATEAGYQLFVTASIKSCGTGRSRRLAHRIGLPYSVSHDRDLIAFHILKAKLTRKLYVLPFN